MWRLVLASVVGVGSPSLAAAQAPPANAEAQRLFDEARALLEANDHDGACPRFERSHQLDPAPGTELNLAECAEHAGQLALAWRRFEAVAAEYDRIDQPARARFARGRAAALAPRLVLVVVRIAAPATPGLTLQIAGRDVPAAAEVSDRVDPGAIAVAVRAPGHEPFAAASQAVAGTTVVVKVPALRGAAIARTASRGDGPRRRGRVRLALGLGAAGGGALIAGGVLGALAYRQNRDARDRQCGPVEPPACTPEGIAAIDSAGRKADAASVLGVAGAALAAGAAIVYFTAPRERVAVAPLAGHRSVGLTLVARF